MKTLVIAEHDNTSLKTATLNAVAAAGHWGRRGYTRRRAGCGAVADAAAQVPGVSKSFVRITALMNTSWRRT
ncbi:MAG: hypothetical protein CM15mP84_07530 [Cellvibrionales bacterium]|nr:MAG: hypothetical protein CM15mP84_07530 [Cellvibrionales bacterium]